VMHEGYAGEKAMRQLYAMAASAGTSLAECAGMEQEAGLEWIAQQMSKSRPPALIEYRVDGKFQRVTKRVWGVIKQETAF